jgi:hypothetical protein
VTFAAANLKEPFARRIWREAPTICHRLAFVAALLRKIHQTVDPPPRLRIHSRTERWEGAATEVRDVAMSHAVNPDRNRALEDGGRGQGHAL